MPIGDRAPGPGLEQLRLSPLARRAWRMLAPSARRKILAIYYADRLPDESFLSRTGRRTRRWLLRKPIAGFVASVFGKRILHCFGDSHSRVFLDVQSGFLNETWLTVDTVRGATARGLSNTASSSGASVRFRKVISRIPKERTLLFLLGEIDCGFVIWARAEELRTGVDEELQRSFLGYTRFLTSLLERGYIHLVVVAVPPQTILDDQVWGEVAVARRAMNPGRSPTLEERMALTSRLNDLLAGWAKSNGVGFMAYDQEVVDPSTGQVREAFRNPSHTDHHLNPPQFAEILAGKLDELGYR